MFSAPMVRALLDGGKTQTRRPVKGIDPERLGETMSKSQWARIRRELPDAFGPRYFCPYGQPGDRLWVRETFALSVVDSDGGSPQDEPENWDVIYRADPDQPGGGWADGEGNAIAAPWKPSIHMPRWASRILLGITSVRVERLRDISEADARAEGITIEDRHMSGYCAGEYLPPAVRAYRDLWESIEGPGSWNANPWVWVIEFRRAEP